MIHTILKVHFITINLERIVLKNLSRDKKSIFPWVKLSYQRHTDKRLNPNL